MNVEAREGDEEEIRHTAEAERTWKFLFISPIGKTKKAINMGPFLQKCIKPAKKLVTWAYWLDHWTNILKLGPFSQL